MFSLINVQTSRPRAGGPQTRATRHTLTMHVTKFILVMLLASPALAADTALPIARPDLAKLEHQLARSSARAVRSMRAMAARSTAADAPDPFAPDRRSLAEADYLIAK